MIRVKPKTTRMKYYLEFENLVNYDKSKTDIVGTNIGMLFENLVNYDKSKTVSNFMFSSVAGLRTL